MRGMVRHLTYIIIPVEFAIGVGILGVTVTGLEPACSRVLLLAHDTHPLVRPLTDSLARDGVSELT